MTQTFACIAFALIGAVGHAGEALAPAPKARVMILGTPHLRSFGTNFKPEWTRSLIRALSDFKPDRIGVEQLSPRALHSLAYTPEEQALAEGNDVGAIDTIHRHAALACTALKGLGRQEAWRQAEPLLAREGGLKPEERGHLVLLLLAAEEEATALLHYQRIPENLRHLVVPYPELDRLLDETLTRPNEVIQVALPLAQELHLARLDPIDDQSDAHLWPDFAEKLSTAVQEVKEIRELGDHPHFKAMKAGVQQAQSKGDLLSLYKLMNSPSWVDEDDHLQWGIWLSHPLPGEVGRLRLQAWEVRNLSIAANIRRVLRPGSRMLILIGASHKAILDRLLAVMPDVVVLQPELFLR